jgi:hypothetical protein
MTECACQRAAESLSQQRWSATRALRAMPEAAGLHENKKKRKLHAEH